MLRLMPPISPHPTWFQAENDDDDDDNDDDDDDDNDDDDDDDDEYNDDEDDDLESPNLKSSTAEHVFFEALADDFHNATAI